MKKYDVIVIGSGGGSKITRPAANLGHTVAIIEKGALGGTCLNHGCIPSKMLIHPADIVSEIRDAYRFELEVNQHIDVRFSDLVNRVTRTVTADSDSIAPMYEAHERITYYPHACHFVSDKVIEVNGEQITADRIFIVAGCRAHIPAIPGLEGTPYLTYKEALRNSVQPKKLLVIGGGYIAVELGYFYGAMGTQVEFIVRSGMLRSEDDEVREAFEATFSSRFPVHFKSSPTQVRYEGNIFYVTVRDENNTDRVLTADALLVATGVIPNTDVLQLAHTSIVCSESGYVQVDDFLQTSVPGVYAFGDIIGTHLFRHAANYQGEYVFNRVFGDATGPLRYPPMPHAVFSWPQVAGVGVTEQEAIAKGIPYVAARNDYKNSAMGMALQSTFGFCKLIFHRETHALIGAHIMGKDASTMIHMCIAYMKMNATVEDMLDTIYIHPALPEIIRNTVRKAMATLCAI